MTTDPVNPEPTDVPTDVTTELYKAALGHWNQDYYLLRFGAFDADSKKRATWHWPAFLSTLNWLVFRRMWGWALGYAAVAMALALAIFGVGKLVFHYSDSAEKVLAALFLLAVFVLPGLFANAVYYRFCKIKIAKAVAASASIQEAYALLAKEASSKKRLLVLALINVGIVALIAVVATLLPNLNQAGKKLAPTTKTAAAPTPAASKPKPVATHPVAVPAAAPASAPAARASAPAAPTATASAPLPAAAASKPEPIAKPQKPTAAELTVKPAPAVKPAKPEVAADAKAKTATAKPEPSAKPQKPAAAEVAVKPAPAVKATQPEVAAGTTTGAARAGSETPPKASAKANRPERRFFIQVGAFATDTHVRDARAKVEAIGLTTFTQPVETPAGRLTRVRVGPFDSKAGANKAAAQIRATGLPTLLLKL